MSIELDLNSDTLPTERLDRFVRDLNLALGESGALRSELATIPSKEDEKGAATVLGKILLEVLKTSAAGALIETLGAFFNREKSVVGKITFPNGTVIEVNAKNLASGEFETTLNSLVAQSAAT